MRALRERRVDRRLLCDWGVGRRLVGSWSTLIVNAWHAFEYRSTSIAVACVPRALTELHDLDDVLTTGLAAEAAGEAAAAAAGTQGAGIMMADRFLCE